VPKKNSVLQPICFPPLLPTDKLTLLALRVDNSFVDSSTFESAAKRGSAEERPDYSATSELRNQCRSSRNISAKESQSRTTPEPRQRKPVRMNTPLMFSLYRHFLHAYRFVLECFTHNRDSFKKWSRGRKSISRPLLWKPGYFHPIALNGLNRMTWQIKSTGWMSLQPDWVTALEDRVRHLTVSSHKLWQIGNG
jgi:hypothetical protein